MNIQHQVINCRVCNRPRQFLEHELIVKIINKEGDPVGIGRKVRAVNLLLYCRHCQVNYSEAWPYNDEKSVEPFIGDVKKHAAHFDARKYLEVSL